MTWYICTYPSKVIMVVVHKVNISFIIFSRSIISTIIFVFFILQDLFIEIVFATVFSTSTESITRHLDFIVVTCNCFTLRRYKKKNTMFKCSVLYLAPLLLIAASEYLSYHLLCATYCKITENLYRTYIELNMK